MSIFFEKNQLMEKDSHLSYWPYCTTLEGVDTHKTGKINPIELPIFRFAHVNRGSEWRRSIENYAKIYDANTCMGHETDRKEKVFKVIPFHKFSNGDEIRITKIAAVCGVSPKFYSAFLAQEDSKWYVYIEMENGGPTTYHNRVDQFSEPQLLHLFTKIRILAEHKIAYKDLHFGNILADGRLIDFDGAMLCRSENETVRELFTKGAYFPTFLNVYQNREDLTDESKQLIRWFKEHDLSDDAMVAAATTEQSGSAAQMIRDAEGK